MMKLPLAVCAAIIGLMGTWSGAVQAAPVLPEAVAYLNALDVPPSLLTNAVYNPTTGLTQVPFGLYNFAGVPGNVLPGDTFSVILSPSLYILATTSATSEYCCGPEVQAEITYFVEVTGPSNVSVPLTITGNLAGVSAGPEGGGFGFAALSVGVGGVAPAGTFAGIFGDDAFYLADGCTGDSECRAFDVLLPGENPFSAPFTLPSNTVEAIDLELFTGSNIGATTASVDPVITIDPTFLANNPGFSLAFSPNIEQTTPTNTVPEPAAILLLATGLIGLGAARRRSWRLRQTANHCRAHPDSG